MGGPETRIWNGFLDTRGSLLGGNTFGDNGNRTWSVVRPPPYQGVSAPFEGKHMLRFQPIDLYVMGFLPESAVPPLRSFMHAAPGNIAEPPEFGLNWVSSVGPNMGTRPAGVTIRAVSMPMNKAVPRADQLRRDRRVQRATQPVLRRRPPAHQPAVGDGDEARSGHGLHRRQHGWREEGGSAQGAGHSAGQRAEAPPRLQPVLLCPHRVPGKTDLHVRRGHRRRRLFRVRRRARRREDLPGGGLPQARASEAPRRFPTRAASCAPCCG